MLVRIGPDTFVLQAQWPTTDGTRVATDKRGGYVYASVTAVHTHACIARRWGRKNHHKECNCGAEELYGLARFRDEEPSRVALLRAEED